MYEKNTKYENSTIFKFLPGHVAIIKSLPDEIVKIDEKKKQKTSTKRRRIETDNPQTVLSNDEINSTNEVSNDLNTADGIPTFEEIKDELIKKIINFGIKKNIPLDEFCEENPLNFRYENEMFKCSVKCAHCEKIIPCNHLNIGCVEISRPI